LGEEVCDIKRMAKRLPDELLLDRVNPFRGGFVDQRTSYLAFLSSILATQLEQTLGVSTSIYRATTPPELRRRVVLVARSTMAKQDASLCIAPAGATRILSRYQAGPFAGSGTRIIPHGLTVVVPTIEALRWALQMRRRVALPPTVFSSLEIAAQVPRNVGRFTEVQGTRERGKTRGQQLFLRSYRQTGCPPRPNSVSKNRRLQVCQQCDMAFHRLYSLQRHTSAIHGNLRPHACKHCKAVFTQESNVRRHHNNVHLQKRPYGCSLCGKSFAALYGLNRHLQGVHRLRTKRVMRTMRQKP